MFKVLKKILQYPRLTQGYPKRAIDSSLFIGKPAIDGSKCTKCGECIAHCPSAAITENAQTGIPVIDLNACIFCTLCEEVCPADAIVMTSEFELAETTRNDESFKATDEYSDGESYEELGKRVENKIRNLFGRSLQIREVDAGSCNGCDYEINALNNPFNDIERFGIHFVASPRHADMLLVTGTATRNMELALLKTYEATPDPKLVVAVGACACSGGIFRDTYATRNGIGSLVPVDVYIPGCPPRPQAILYGILKAIDRIEAKK
ncbi:MAG TPA: NADH-quinone oxidoreductase subunit NuoB [Anaerovoracaceae bacterium]|nr:NADH-quinone oxidoreductase subunit NuoB [Anaerovoracaceae bacterium]